MTTPARAAVLARFRWEAGHADVWRIFADAAAFAAVVDGLAAPWRHRDVTLVVGIESRGFLLGGAVAAALGVGFVAIRKGDGLLPGATHAVLADADYRGRQHRLRMQAVLARHDRVVLVDDWAERGSQSFAARSLVETAGATFLGLTVLVDQLTPEARARLGEVTALVTADELGPSE